MVRRGMRWFAGLAALPALTLAALGVVGAAYTPDLTIPAEFEGKHVRVEDVTLRVLQRGAGKDVLLVHGSPGSIEDFAPVTAALESRFRVTVFDRPGHGFSGDTGRYGIAYNASVAQALIRALGLKDVTVVGHSYGGATAVAMALDAPSNVHAYVVLDSAVYRGSRHVTPLLRALALPFVGIGLAACAPASVGAAPIRRGIAESFKVHAPPEDFFRLRTRLWNTPKVSHAIAMETRGATPELAALSTRYPSIRGRFSIAAQADDAFRREAAQHLAKDIVGASLRLLPRTGHMMQFERTDDVVHLIAEAAR